MATSLEALGTSRLFDHCTWNPCKERDNFFPRRTPGLHKALEQHYGPPGMPNPVLNRSCRPPNKPQVKGCEETRGCFYKLRVHFLGVLAIRAVTILASRLGPLICGKLPDLHFPRMLKGCFYPRLPPRSHGVEGAPPTGAHMGTTHKHTHTTHLLQPWNERGQVVFSFPGDPNSLK